MEQTAFLWPLFFVAPDPRYRRVGKLASTLHRARPAEFLVALKSAVRELPAQERSVGRAYALGYVCRPRSTEVAGW